MSGSEKVAGPLGVVWRAIGKPVYRRLLGRYFEAIITRLNSTLGQLTSMRSEMAEIRRRLDEIVDFQQKLDRQMAAVATTHWDETASNRRLAAIEDRLGEAELSP